MKTEGEAQVAEEEAAVTAVEDKEDIKAQLTNKTNNTFRNYSFRK